MRQSLQIVVKIIISMDMHDIFFAILVIIVLCQSLNVVLQYRSQSVLLESNNSSFSVIFKSDILFILFLWLFVVTHSSHGQEKGLLLVLGQGDVGQLGLGEDVLERKKPALVTLPEGIVQAVAGGMHTVCLSDTGNVSGVQNK